MCIRDSCSTIYAQNINEKLHTDTDTVTAANNHLFTVGNVNITGNTKTKDFIMLREIPFKKGDQYTCLLYTSPSPRDRTRSRMPSSA